MKQIEQTNSGVRFQGDWHEVVLFSHVLAKFLEDNATHRETVDVYEKWMPQDGEEEKDIKKKTAAGACIKHKKVEEGFKGFKEELNDAEHKLADSVHDIVNGRSPTEDVGQAVKDIERLVAAESLKSLRKMERSIYNHIMLKFNPYYFDTEDFSVNLECKNKNRYALSINISTEELRNKVQKRFED
ncbi:MAG: DUF5828 family protein [Candidatus Saliniplasma sp.]